MAVFGRKGRDTHPENEGMEQQKGMSKTELQALMKRATGHAEGDGMPAAPLMPNPAKGGKRGPVR